MCTKNNVVRYGGIEQRFSVKVWGLIGGEATYLCGVPQVFHFFFELELHVEEVHFILVLFNLIKSSLKY